jgi:hypothetical protein
MAITKFPGSLSAKASIHRKMQKYVYSSNLFSQLFSVYQITEGIHMIHPCDARVISPRMSLSTRESGRLYAMLTDFVNAEEFRFPQCVRNL